VPNPDVAGREKILKVHMRKVPLASDVDPKIIARGTPGFSGADLANLVNEAALMAARRGKRSVAMGEFEHAKDKVMMGAERRSMVMTEDEKRLTAFHEAGHALCMLYAEAHEPLHKVTIIPRGRALGVTMFLPERDKYSQSKQEIKAMLTSHLDELHALAKGLLEYETLSADEIRRVIKGERIVRDTSTPAASDEARPGRRSSVPPAGRPTGLEPEPQPGN